MLVSSITSRSMPMPSPPAGGMPCRSARMKSWSILAIESSSASPSSCVREQLFLQVGIVQFGVGVGHFHALR